MISSEVQRTLVKSPPELWTELSDPAALGRHLGEFGDIRITRVEPEKTVEWEAENTSGSVLIKPSGWGTRVILKATRELPEPEPQAQAEAQPEAEDDFEPAAETDEASPAESMLEQASEIYPEPLDGEPAAWMETEWEYDAEPEEEPQTEPRRGFLARLFSWRRRERPTELAPAPDGELPLEWRAATDAAFEAGPEWPQALEPSIPEAPESDSPEPEPSAPGSSQPEAPAAEAPQPEPPGPRVPQPQTAAGRERGADTPSEPDIASELAVAEGVAADEVAAEEVTAVLTSMLDRLGTAHHRPFSRA